MQTNRRRLLAGSTALVAAPFVMRHAALGADPIKVAGIHDASGGLDIYGQPMVATLTYAVEELNAAGGLLGREVQLINYDPQSNIQLYTQFATEAATREKVAVVHGGITSASREAIRPILKRFQTLYFYNTQYEGGVCDRNIFCTGSGPAQNVSKLVPYLMQKWGKKAYIVAADYNYGQITAKWVTKYVREGGGEIVAAEFFPLDVTDFGSTIKKIQAAKPDMVVSALVGGAHISFYRQWAAAGMKAEIPMASTTFGGGNENKVLSAAERRRHPRLLRLLPGAGHARQQGLPRQVPGQARRSLSGRRARHDDLSRPQHLGAGCDQGRQHRADEGDRGPGERDRLRGPGRHDHDRPEDPPRHARCPPCRMQGAGLQRARDLPTAAAGRYPVGLRPRRQNPNANQQFVVDVKI